MTSEEKFNAAVNVIRNLPKNGAYQPSNELLLRFYSYYKQATEGPCRDPKPSFWEVVKKAKWTAWTRLGNMSKREAMNNYVEELKKIVETMSYTENVATFLGSLDSFYESVPVEDLELIVGPILERMRLQTDSPFSISSTESSEMSSLKKKINNDKDDQNGEFTEKCISDKSGNETKFIGITKASPSYCDKEFSRDFVNSDQRVTEMQIKSEFHYSLNNYTGLQLNHTSDHLQNEVLCSKYCTMEKANENTHIMDILNNLRNDINQIIIRISVFEQVLLTNILPTINKCLR